MLAAWTEILPLFLVKWLARRYCCRIMEGVGDARRVHFTARPDVLVKEANNG